MLNCIMIIFLGTKIFGNTREKVQSYNQPIKKIGIIALVIICTISISCTIVGIFFVYIDSSGDKKGYLKSFRIIGNMICFVTDIIVTVNSNDQLIVSLTYLRTFDISAKFCENNYKSTLIMCRIILGLIQINWLIVATLTYLNNSNFPFIISLNYIFYYSSMSMQIMKFSGLMMLLYRRFDYLHQLVHSNVNEKPRICLQLEKVWWLHYNLSTATKKLNNIYQIQLLLWVSSFFLNALANSYSVIYPSQIKKYSQIRDSFCMIGFCSNIIILTAFCHYTSHRANEISNEIFSPFSVVKIEPRTVENDNAAVGYFCIYRIHIRAAYGFIKIDLPLLISIFGALTTYLVILQKSPTENNIHEKHRINEFI